MEGLLHPLPGLFCRLVGLRLVCLRLVCLRLCAEARSLSLELWANAAEGLANCRRPDAAVPTLGDFDVFREGRGCLRRTEQAIKLADFKLNISAEELLKRAQERRRAMDTEGILDTLMDLQPKHPPKLDENLVGKMIEVMWRYWRPRQEGEPGEAKKKQVGLTARIVSIVGPRSTPNVSIFCRSSFGLKQ